MNKMVMASNEKSYPKSMRLYDIALDLNLEPMPLIAKLNNELKSLNHLSKTGGRLQFLDIHTEEGFRAYQKGMCMILAKAVKQIFNCDIYVDHSINKNLYCELSDPSIVLTEKSVKQIEEEMQNIVKACLPIEKVYVNLEYEMDILEKNNLTDLMNLANIKNSRYISLYKISDFYDYYMDVLPINTSFFQVFHLVLEFNGFILELPDKNNTKQVLNYRPIPNISKVFREYSSWMNILGVGSIPNLNHLVSKGEADEIIRISEALHEKKIVEIADMILQRKKDIKIILIAGPTSSGKTTFAKRLCVQLRVNGFNPISISIDDYFKNRDETPLDALGNKDFESIQAIDTALFNKQIMDLFSGEAVSIPSFNFLTGMKEYRGRSYQLSRDDIVVVEGIHGLNESLTQQIAHQNKFHIFVSALTQLNINHHNRISTTDTRMIRRMVRDHQYRGIQPIDTINMWDAVTRGEAQNIFPYQVRADATFNSALVYELCVFKQYIEALLFHITKKEEEYPAAQRLRNIFDCVLGIPSEEIPNNSIIREFIGGSSFRM